MNLNELFSKQAELDKRIVEEHNLQGQDLLKKKCVALICELYECANEARFFKFWSKNQKANTEKVISCESCDGQGMVEGEPCFTCVGGVVGYENPLLEEYVDTLHFALSIANDLGYTEHEYTGVEEKDLNSMIIGLTNIITILDRDMITPTNTMMSIFFNHLIKLGYQLGFDEGIVKHAYNKKHKENHRRQEVGY